MALVETSRESVQALCSQPCRQITGFDSGLQAVDDGLMNLFIRLGQLRMNRITMRANLRAEFAD